MPVLGRLALMALALWFAAGARAANAEEASPSPVREEQRVDPLAGESPGWRAKNAEAQEVLRSGDFLRARIMLVTLASLAATDAGRAQAQSLERLAAFWLEGHYRLRSDDAVAVENRRAPPAAFVDRRTADELAVLYIEGVFYGIGAGLTLATYTEPSSPAGVVLPALAFAGATEGLIALVDAKVGFRYGAAQATASGLLLGLEEGIVWTWWSEARPSSGSTETKDVFTVVLATSTAGAVIGGTFGQLVGTTPGNMALTGSAALWSAVVAGFTVGALVDSSSSNHKAHPLLAAGLALNVGTVGGAILASKVSPSIARARFVDLGAIGGGVLFGGLYLALADRDAGPRGAYGAVAAGIATGVATAWLLTRDLDADESRRASANTSALLVPFIVPSLSPTPGLSSPGATAGVAGVF